MEALVDAIAAAPWYAIPAAAVAVFAVVASLGIGVKIGARRFTRPPTPTPTPAASFPTAATIDRLEAERAEAVAKIQAHHEQARAKLAASRAEIMGAADGAETVDEVNAAIDAIDGRR